MTSGSVSNLVQQIQKAKKNSLDIDEGIADILDDIITKGSVRFNQKDSMVSKVEQIFADESPRLLELKALLPPKNDANLGSTDTTPFDFDTEDLEAAIIALESTSTWEEKQYSGEIQTKIQSLSQLKSESNSTLQKGSTTPRVSKENQQQAENTVVDLEAKVAARKAELKKREEEIETRRLKLEKWQLNIKEAHESAKIEEHKSKSRRRSRSRSRSRSSSRSSSKPRSKEDSPEKVALSNAQPVPLPLDAESFDVPEACSVPLPLGSALPLQPPTQLPPPPETDIVDADPDHATETRQTAGHCFNCGADVFEDVGKIVANGNVFHQECFSCSKCQIALNIHQYAFINFIYYCKKCFIAAHTSGEIAI